MAQVAQGSRLPLDYPGPFCSLCLICVPFPLQLLLHPLEEAAPATRQQHARKRRAAAVDVLRGPGADPPPPLSPRPASIARKIYCKQGLGVGQLRKFYGGLYRLGHNKEHFTRGSGGHLRYILQQLEKIGLLEKYEGSKGGRKITSAGQRDLDSIATTCEFTTPAIFTAAAPAPVEDDEEESDDEEI